MRHSSINPGELLAAFAVIAFGGFILWRAMGLDFGTPARMGPGFFPVAIGGFLVIVGLVLAVESIGTPRVASAISIRSILAVISGLIAFAVIMPRLGLVPATIALVVLSLLAEERQRWRLTVGLAIALAAIGYFVFNVGFRIPLDPFWW